MSTKERRIYLYLCAKYRQCGSMTTAMRATLFVFTGGRV